MAAICKETIPAERWRPAPNPNPNPNPNPPSTQMAARSSNPAAVEISVVLCTYNRASLLVDALTALVCQADPPSYEVVVVDNNSSDDTRAVIARFAASGNIRYTCEPV